MNNRDFKNFDLIIIGGGAEAFAAAIRANELSAKTALINSGLPWGGTCVNVGCMPSKTLLYICEILHHTKLGVPGVELEVKTFDFQKVVHDELTLVEKLRQEKYEKVLKYLEHVVVIKEKVKFFLQNKVEMNSKKLSAEKFIIAAGSTATVPPINGIQEVGFVTHVEALKMQKQPRV